MGWFTGRTAARVGAATMVLVAIAAGPSTGAVLADAPAPAAASVTVTPSSGLVDGQKVTVKVAATADQFPLPLLCTPGGTLDADLHGPCGIAGLTLGFGGGDPNKQVMTINATFAHDLGVGVRTDCRVDACEVVAVDAASDNLAVIARAPVSFVPGSPLRPTPVLSLTPGAMLVDQQQITASLTGAVGNGGILAQCGHTPTSLTDLFASCLPLDSVVIGPGGGSSSSFPISAFVSLPSGLVDCRAVGASCAIALYRPAGDAIPAATLQFDPAGAVEPQILLSPSGPDGPALTADLVGFSPGATATLRLCNAAGTCLTTPTASGLVSATGVVGGLTLDLAGIDFAEASLVCGAGPQGDGGCYPSAHDTDGTQADVPDATFVFGDDGGGPFHSARLPVSVTPDTDLHDRQRVKVTAGDALATGPVIETLLCDGRFLTDGFGACDFRSNAERQARRAAPHAFGARTTGDAGTVVRPFTVHRELIADDGAPPFDCRDGNVDPVAFAALPADTQAEVLAPDSGYRTCVVVVDDPTTDDQSGLAPIAFAGAVFKPLPAGPPTTPPTTPTTAEPPTEPAEPPPAPPAAPAEPATPVDGVATFAG